MELLYVLAAGMMGSWAGTMCGKIALEFAFNGDRQRATMFILLTALGAFATGCMGAMFALQAIMSDSPAAIVIFMAGLLFGFIMARHIRTEKQPADAQTKPPAPAE